MTSSPISLAVVSPSGVEAAFLGGVDGEFSGGKAEDEPTPTRVDRWKSQSVTQESAVGVGIAAVK